MKKPGVLLVPKWKERTYKTHVEHIARQLEHGRNYRLAFLGDSMMERWLTTGRNLWDEHFAQDCINLGVGGDGIEHLLYRLKGTKDIAGCLDHVEVERVLLMIGTNNLAKRSVEHVFEGIANIVSIVREKQPKASIRLFGLTY